jgi:hypothetical protein
MKRIFLLILVAIAVWYGWKRWPEVLSHAPSHEAVVVNNAGAVLTRLRLTVDGQTFAKERLVDGEKVTFAFKVANDASFDLVWEYESSLGERHWTGGMVPKGPLVQRHYIQIDPDGQVTYEARSKGLASPTPAQ